MRMTGNFVVGATGIEPVTSSVSASPTIGRLILGAGSMPTTSKCSPGACGRNRLAGTSLRDMAWRAASVLPHGRRSLPGQTHDVDPAALAPVLAEFLAKPATAAD
jgi:hypothetical protein